MVFMQLISEDDFLKNLDDNIEHMTSGDVFIYPTDTFYGVGCDARRNASVKRIRRIKNSYGNPFSVIAPSKEWIIKNLVVESAHETWLSKLPGPYTLIFRKRVVDCVAESVNPSTNTLGVRIPYNWFADVVSKAGFPVITTSINLHGKVPFASVQDIPDDFKSMVDFAVGTEVIRGKASTIVDLTGLEPIVIERG